MTVRVLAVYRDQDDYSRAVIDFLRDFKYQTGHDLETVNPDTTNGVHFCETYDIVQYPAIIALDDNSMMQNCWNGLPLPTISEVSYYVQQN